MAMAGVGAGGVLRGIWLRIISSYLGSMAAVMSEAMKPGATALQVIPRGANSRATVFVKPMTPACVGSQHCQAALPYIEEPLLWPSTSLRSPVHRPGKSRARWTLNKEQYSFSTRTSTGAQVSRMCAGLLGSQSGLPWMRCSSPVRHCR